MALALLVVSRDVMIIGAVILSWLLDRPMEIQPLGDLQGQYLRPNRPGRGGARHAGLRLAARRLVVAAEWAVAALTLASLAAYFRRWMTHMSA